MLGVRISEDLENKIERYIKKKKMTKSQFVKEALNTYLRQEELKSWHDEMTMNGLKEIDEGKGISEKVVLNMLNRWVEDD